MSIPVSLNIIPYDDLTPTVDTTMEHVIFHLSGLIGIVLLPLFSWGAYTISIIHC